MDKIILPRGAELIIDRLHKHGYRADVVGGAVRNAYLGRDIPDYDITTNARPEQVKEIFSDMHTIDTGIKHGTVTVRIDGEGYEVTTYRLDGEYKDARHPESVQFTDELALDLSRRDFTMNAMCYNRKDGITDLFGGISDIERKTVRTVGQARTRFSEDALRILRALRFASVLDFEIEEGTRAAIFEKAHLLSEISAERIWVELKKLISGVGAHRILREYREIFESILSLSLKKMPPKKAFDSGNGSARILSLFYMGSDKPSESFDNAMLALHTDNKTRKDGAAALQVIEEFSLATERQILLALMKYGIDAVELAVNGGIVVGKYTCAVQDNLQRALISGLPYTLSGLAIGGRELMSVGLKGEKIGEVLTALLIAVIEGKCENTKEALLQMVADI